MITYIWKYKYHIYYVSHLYTTTKKSLAKVSFNGLTTSTHYLQFISLKMEKKYHRIYQIYLKTIKLPYLTKNGTLNNFDFDG